MSLTMTEETKDKVLKTFKEAYPQDLSIVEASAKAGVSDPTGAMYIRVLEAEGKIEFARMVGRSKMFRLK
jgi:predicted transcriptional regulator